MAADQLSEMRITCVPVAEDGNLEIKHILISYFPMTSDSLTSASREGNCGTPSSLSACQTSGPALQTCQGDTAQAITSDGGEDGFSDMFDSQDAADQPSVNLRWAHQERSDHHPNTVDSESPDSHDAGNGDEGPSLAAGCSGPRKPRKVPAPAIMNQAYVRRVWRRFQTAERRQRTTTGAAAVDGSGRAATGRTAATTWTNSHEASPPDPPYSPELDLSAAPSADIHGMSAETPLSRPVTPGGARRARWEISPRTSP
jgi:hypothetical protein